MAADWTSFPFTYDGVTREVFTRSAAGNQSDKPNGPGILVMHEMGGITKRTIEFADSLTRSDEDHGGFDVFLPVMFGRFGQGFNLPKPMARLNSADGLVQMMCARAEFRAMQHQSSSPIAGWMRAMAREIGERTGGAVGVIGMCLTGGVVFSMVWEPAVGGVVAAQPSLPLFAKTKRTVSGADFTASADRAKPKEAADERTPRVQVHHFTGDRICPAERIEQLRRDWRLQTGTELDVRPYEGTAHATLTEDSEAARRDEGTSHEIVRAFFKEALT